MYNDVRLRKPQMLNLCLFFLVLFLYKKEVGDGIDIEHL